MYLWDIEEIYGLFWDVVSVVCVFVVKRLLDEKVDLNIKDEDGLIILFFISDLFFDCEFDEINWVEVLVEEK